MFNLATSVQYPIRLPQVQASKKIKDMMKNLLSGFLLAALLLSCGTKETSEATSVETEEAAPDVMAQDDFIIVGGRRVGKITKDNATKEGIIQAYGTENVQEDSIYIGEGFYWDGLRLFPGTKNELEIAWDPDTETTSPAFFRVSKEDTDWRTDQNITIGTTLEELLAINGKAFNFLGFGWDYGGAVSNLNGGNISGNLYIRLENVGKIDENLLGDQEISTNHPAVKGADIRVVRLETKF